MMKHRSLLSGVAVAACLLFGTSASKTRIKADKKDCTSLSSNANDICLAAANANFGMS
jgi:hypothetical protein